MNARGRAWRDELTGLAWAGPWLIGSAVFVLLPMGMSAYYALTDYPLLEPPMFVGLKNFRDLAGDPTFWRVVKNTALYAGVSIPVFTLVALVLAGLLNSRVRFGRVYQAAVFIPTLVPLIASAMVWFWLFNGEYGLVNKVLGPLLRPLGLSPPAWIADEAWVLPSMVLMTLWGVGQSVVIYVAAMQDVPRQLYEAAELDGMGPVRRFVHVTLPMISPAILFNVIALTISAVQVFAVPYVMFRRPQGTNPAGHYYTMYLYETGFVYGRMGYACAMAWIQLLVVLALTGLMMFASRRLVHYTRT